MSGRGSYRGAPGFFGTPQENSPRPFHGGRFSNPNYAQRGSFRGNRSRGRSNNRYQFSTFSKDNDGGGGNGYFHPEMLEDPWKNLITSSKTSLSSTTSSLEDGNCAKMSDSMIPQVCRKSSSNHITRKHILSHP